MPSVNPFAVAGASLPAGFLQVFLVVMALAVVAGTLFDIIHKGFHGRKQPDPETRFFEQLV